MKVNYLLGVNNYILERTDTVKQGIIVDAMGEHVKTGAPCLVFSNTTKTNFRTKARKLIIVPFPTKQGYHPRLFLDTLASNFVVKELENSKLLNSITTINTCSINSKKFINSIEYVKNNGPLTLIVNKNIKLQHELIKVVTGLGNKFKYSSLLFNDAIWAPTPMTGEKPLFSLTLIDINQCIPIFNPSKVDGVVLHGTIIYPKKTASQDKLVNSFEFFMLFSQYKENLTTLRGNKLYICDLCTTTSLNKVVKAYNKCYSTIGVVAPTNKVKKKSTKDSMTWSTTIESSRPTYITSTNTWTTQ